MSAAPDHAPCGGFAQQAGVMVGGNLGEIDGNAQVNFGKIDVEASRG
jgi:hypothetical protein